ncbi:hypothetical protein RND81_14G056400 [Saponaria officinalis]|uniref:Activator of Hsp90 ATPase AHSA1-like N-terminal domain-containing protein n=1 Tax=Saponaria officinalis TaxID=3572 RepID=A0AAW1GLS5_SAPOF
MAKFGEGDKRWIVSDRPDGTNVHNWHWSETDCLEYSRTFFSAAFNNLPVTTADGGADGGVAIRITKLDKLSGEAYVNIRKGKIIPGYELSLSISWEGEAKDEGGNCVLKGEGKVEIPYVSDENAGEMPEIRVSFGDDGVIGRKIKEVFLSKAKSVILGKVKEYEDDMGSGGPCRGDVEAKKVPVKSTKAVSGNAGEGNVGKGKEKEKEKEKRGFRRIELSEKFRCRVCDLYEILMDENRWKGFTQSNAKISKEVGGEFSIFDGSVTGVNVELEVGKLIVQKWRFGNWPDGVFSTVKLTFEEPEPGLTVVKLVQTGVPEEDRYGNETVVENTERGWRDLIFQRIRAIFGFGL